MCAPNLTNALLHKLRPKPSTKKCPSNNIVLESGTATTHSPPNARKRTFSDMLKTGLLFGLCFVVVLFKGNTIFAFSGTNATLDQISKLTHDLDSFDRLKKEFVNDELELRWDRQHIAELLENVQSMRDGFGRVTQSFYQQEHDLVKKNGSLREALITSSELNTNIRKLDHDEAVQLSKQVEKVHSELENEVAKNAVLKKLLAETIQEMQKENIPVSQAALRGSPSLKVV